LEDMNEVYTIGMLWAMTFEAALKIALKQVGYKKLDGEAMYQASQGGGEAPGAGAASGESGDGNVVDVDFEEVQDDDKKSA
jgi:hypothetical protein